MPEILFTRLPHGAGLPVPAPATAGSAGHDVASADAAVLAPMERRLFKTGFALAIPPGWECQIRPRSGLALKHGLTLPNTPATIDSDYRGELMVALVNLGPEPLRGDPGDADCPAGLCPGGGGGLAGSGGAAGDGAGRGRVREHRIGEGVR